MADTRKKRILVIGGGLVGALNACFFAKRGYHVDMYELRDDIRKQQVVKGRSINLALSVRGADALDAVGLKASMQANGIPMFARMIHDLNGKRRPITYGTKDQFIMSIDRRRLNELMLTAAEKYPSVTLHFSHKLIYCDFDNRTATFEKENGEKVTVQGDLMIGCDGAFSAMRRQIMKTIRLNFSQEYIPHGYLELRIPPTNDNQFAMEKSYLHIWPRNTFMMIGLPNVEDNSFVITLFMPFPMFESIKTERDLISFFETTFPDSIPLIGKEALVKLFFIREPLPLVSVKCDPYHIEDKAVIMGDAAHAMVPFYGQGMNCGFEDCLLLNELLDKHQDNLTKAIEEYSTMRSPDAKAICDLAMYNYVEMRERVNSKLFLMRKMLDNVLHWLMPNTWVPLYTSVAFTRIPYTECIRNRDWQDKLLVRVLRYGGMACAVGGSYVMWSHGAEVSQTLGDRVPSSVHQLAAPILDYFQK